MRGAVIIVAAFYSRPTTLFYSGCQVNSFPLKAGLKAGFRLTASQAASSSGRVAFFILLDIVDGPMNGSSYLQCATPRYLKTVQLS